MKRKGSKVTLTRDARVGIGFYKHVSARVQCDGLFVLPTDSNQKPRNMTRTTLKIRVPENMHNKSYSSVESEDTHVP